MVFIEKLLKVSKTVERYQNEEILLTKRNQKISQRKQTCNVSGKQVNDKVRKLGLELAKNSEWFLRLNAQTLGRLKVQNYLPFRLKLVNC